MCGFIGGTDSAWDYAAALATLAHRGPDASRLDLDGEVKVGFRRLSIIDLAETANQPMYTSGRDRWIVFNGEIYGFKRLRRELEALGHKFHTSSDTEVVLNAFVEWGDDFVSHLDGMFGIVIPVGTFYGTQWQLWIATGGIVALILIPWSLLDLYRINREDWQDITIEGATP